MFERLRMMFDLWRDQREIEALSDREVEDLGVTRDQLRAFARLPMDVPERLTAMAAIFGLSEADLKQNYADYLELLEVCAHCGARRQCAETLDSFATARPEACGFCPNAGTYAQKAGLAA
ncbi:hypothetical protein L0V05_10160 [Tabrizicola sp. J26]|uniref:hypothetical protein n=1 Tax=Alitabrizicola rongguiensis TaxID=2909234 RepID=UPI001F3A5B70|nr:hypothetical protein [Tabrizicola rongguiensis]MCF1709180.1 hypothetical protein [Tabrizicola rongguiensis]